MIPPSDQLRCAEAHARCAAGDHHRFVARITPDQHGEKDHIYLVVGDRDDTPIAQQLTLLFVRLVAHHYLTPDAPLERFLRCAAQLDQEALLAFHLWSVARMEAFADVFVTQGEKTLEVLGALP